MVNKNIELLAPVGSMESLYAAVQNGADAVYLGGKLFSARQYANNFDYEELKLAVDYAHIRGVKVYVTVNILIDDNEMKETMDYTKYLYDIDVDGLILQDLGLAYLIRNVFPDFELHGSTQMTINNLPGAIFLEELGFKRVVLAREVPLKEIEKIYENANIELEGFIHGALCVCYSGQCLMSSVIGGRSGNRGKCAQPCRMPYSIINYNNKTIVSDKWDKKYILSPKDLNTMNYIEDIVDSGIISLKIEGRMKRPEYVATIVKNYRRLLDFGKSKINVNNEKDVLQIFNRGFTKGIMLGDFGRDFISYERPDNRGILIGKVIEVDNQSLYIELYENVDEKDGLEFETSNGDYKGIVLNCSAKKGETIKIDHIWGISKNSEVYRTSSNDLLNMAKKSYENENIKYPINLKMEVSIGEPALLKINYNDFIIEVQSNSPVEKAKKLPLSKETILEQLSKLNDTVYYIDNIDIKLEDGSFMSLSEINGLRRNGIKELDKVRKSFNNRKIMDNKEYENRLKHYFIYNKNKSKNIKNISVNVLKKDQFEQLNIDKLDRIYLGFEEELEDIILKVKDKGKEVYFRTDKIFYERDLINLYNTLYPIIDILDGVSVSNIGTFKFIKDNFNTNIHGDIGLNVFNSFTVELLRKHGMDSLTLSPELNISQIESICSKGSTIYESIGYGYLPLMITEHCPMSLIRNCKDNQNCEQCSYSQGYGLRDRKDIDFYMERKNKITTIYNSVPLMILDNLDKVYNSGINMIRLDFTFEKDNIRDIQDVYFDYAKGIIPKHKVDEFLKKYRNKNNITKGHYFRGVI